jgi:hypothetical protein
MKSYVRPNYSSKDIVEGRVLNAGLLTLHTHLHGCLYEDFGLTRGPIPMLPAERGYLVLDPALGRLASI